MRVLAVQNYDRTGLGQVEAALNEANADIDLRRPYLDDTLPADASEHHALIVLGGGQDAMADDDYPYFPALLALIREFAKADKAVLGICLGAQLLARAFGGENRVGAALEFGWCPVEATEAGLADPLLRHLGGNARLFQWHDDTFSLPPGAERLAASAVVENQAFRIGRAVYGTQFHFEADRALVRQWNEDFADVLADRQPDWPYRFAHDAALHGERADAAGAAMARAWVSLIRTA